MVETALLQAIMTGKLNPPTTRPSQVVRNDVVDKILSSSTTGMVLVSAPAGFGKTTVMSQCMIQMEKNSVTTAWLTLDSADNDVTRFLRYLNAAVSKITEDGSDFNSQDDIAFRSPGEVALDILERLSRHRSAFALFLDDFEWIQNKTILSLIKEIVENLPHRGQLVIGTRNRPELGLGRFRARGQLLEVNVHQLRFSIEETTKLLSYHCKPALNKEDLWHIHDRSEGWVTAIWLASLALENHSSPKNFVDRFSGADHAVSDYLAHDVLALQPKPVREFLLRTSILQQLNLSICQELVPDTDAGSMLSYLANNHTFLAPLDSERNIYRYHSLFSEFLRCQLNTQYPEEVSPLHRTASLWFERQKRPVKAITHAIEGGDHQRALYLLELYAEELLANGRMRLLSHWFSAMPSELLKQSEKLTKIWIWSLCFTRGPAEALKALKETRLDQSSVPETQPHVRALRLMILVMMDKHQEAIEAGDSSLDELPSCQPFADMATVNCLANAYAVMGLYSKARKLLDHGRDTQGRYFSAFNAVYSESVEGVIDMIEGRQRQAVARFRLAVGATRRAHPVSLAGGNAWPGMLLASTIYESNQLDQAEKLLHVYGPLARDVGLADHLLLTDIILARIAFSKGDVDQAFQILTELEHFGHMRQLERVVATSRLERSRLLLFQGHEKAAQQQIETAGSDDLWQRLKTLRLPANDLDFKALAQHRWQIYAGDPQDAFLDLDQLISEAHTEHRFRRELKLKLLKAMALYRCGQIQVALDLMGEVINACVNEGYMRLIIDEGLSAGRLVLLYKKTFGEGSSYNANPIMAEYINSLIDGFGSDLNDSVLQSPEDALVESLTPKEFKALQLLSEGYSNNAMAEKLFVSDSTVRTHLRNINSKLKANNRTQAVAIGRRLGLV